MRYVPAWYLHQYDFPIQAVLGRSSRKGYDSTRVHQSCSACQKLGHRCRPANDHRPLSHHRQTDITMSVLPPCSTSRCRQASTTTNPAAGVCLCITITYLQDTHGIDCQYIYPLEDSTPPPTLPYIPLITSILRKMAAWYGVDTIEGVRRAEWTCVSCGD